MQALSSPSTRDSYNLFKAIIQPGCAFTVMAYNTRVQVKSIRKVDQGAEKILLLIQEGVILFLPNLDCFDPIRDAEEIAMNAIPPTVTAWDQIVQEELTYSRKAAALGLLNSSCEERTLTLDKASAVSFISESFESMAKRGLHVIENGFRHCTWKKDNLFLFKTKEEREDPSKWEERMQELVQDVILVCQNGMPIGVDALHTALLRTEKGLYTIRYFGFDFHASKPLATPNYAPYIFEKILEPVVKLEFRETNFATIHFIMDLTERCMELFRTRIALLPAQSGEM